MVITAINFNRGMRSAYSPYGRPRSHDFDYDYGSDYDRFDYDRGGYGRATSGYGSSMGGGRNYYGSGSGNYGNYGRGSGGYDRNRYGSNYGYNPGYGSDYHYDRDFDTDFDMDSDYDYDFDNEPVRWSYQEIWLIPGPFSGIGPENYQRSDDRIREDINERLTQHGRLNARNIQVQVNNGEVTLNGSVDRRQDKRMAEDVAASISGVRDVNNQIRVQERQKSQDWEQQQMQGQQGQQNQQSQYSQGRESQRERSGSGTNQRT